MFMQSCFNPTVLNSQPLPAFQQLLPSSAVGSSVYNSYYQTSLADHAKPMLPASHEGGLSGLMKSPIGYGGSRGYDHHGMEEQ